MFSSEQEGSEEGRCDEDNTGLDQGGGGVEGAVGALVGTTHLREKNIYIQSSKKTGLYCNLMG